MILGHPMVLFDVHDINQFEMVLLIQPFALDM